MYVLSREISQAEEAYRNSTDPLRANVLLDRVANLYHSAVREIEEMDVDHIDGIYGQDEDELRQVIAK